MKKGTQYSIIHHMKRLTLAFKKCDFLRGGVGGVDNKCLAKFFQAHSTDFDKI